MRMKIRENGKQKDKVKWMKNEFEKLIEVIDEFDLRHEKDAEAPMPFPLKLNISHDK